MEQWCQALQNNTMKVVWNYSCKFNTIHCKLEEFRQTNCEKEIILIYTNH